jgi:hypothetical protein
VNDSLQNAVAFVLYGFGACFLILPTILLVLFAKIIGGEIWHFLIHYKNE